MNHIDYKYTSFMGTNNNCVNAWGYKDFKRFPFDV